MKISDLFENKQEYQVNSCGLVELPTDYDTSALFNDNRYFIQRKHGVDLYRGFLLGTKEEYGERGEWHYAVPITLENGKLTIDQNGHNWIDILNYSNEDDFKAVVDAYYENGCKPS